VAESVFLLPWPLAEVSWKRPDLAERYEQIMLLREDVMKRLEIARQAKEIGHALDARVTLFTPDENLSLLQQYRDEWPQIFITSQVVISESPVTGSVAGNNLPQIHILVTRATGAKCARCWNHLDEVGLNQAHPELCVRCVGAVT
jgi:isoleucyl-tRNA synthetase